MSSEVYGILLTQCRHVGMSPNISDAGYCCSLLDGQGHDWQNRGQNARV